MPWITNEQAAKNQAILLELSIRFAKLEAQLEAEVNRRERAELELSRLNDDFRGLIALTAGRIPPKLAPEFDKDLFEEDTRQAVTFLSPDPDDFGISGEEILQAIDEGRLKDDELSG